MPSSFVAVLVVAAEKHGSNTVYEFFRQVAVGANLAETDPAYQLRDRFQNRKAGTSFSQDAALALCIKCMNAHIKGRPIHQLKYSVEHEFPQLV